MEKLLSRLFLFPTLPCLPAPPNYSLPPPQEKICHLYQELVDFTPFLISANTSPPPPRIASPSSPDGLRLPTRWFPSHILPLNPLCPRHLFRFPHSRPPCTILPFCTVDPSSIFVAITLPSEFVRFPPQIADPLKDDLTHVPRMLQQAFPFAAPALLPLHLLFKFGACRRPIRTLYTYSRVLFLVGRDYSTHQVTVLCRCVEAAPFRAQTYGSVCGFTVYFLPSPTM